MLALVAWLAQEVAPTVAAPGWLESLGPYIAFGSLAMIAIGWLARQLSQERAANRDLSDRLVDQAEKSIPVLERNTAALERMERTR